MAVETVRGCDHAGISLIQRRKIETVATTDDVATKGDQQQYVLDQGPCLDSIREQETIRSNGLADDNRWPEWGPWVHDNLGVNSMLCFQLFTTEESYGALNLYSDHADAFDSHDQAVGLALAAHAAVAFAASREIQGLETAMTNRTIIGQAEGILMERYDLTADRAFAFLTRISQNENRRLAEIAEELVADRQLPGRSGHDA